MSDKRATSFRESGIPVKPVLVCKNADALSIPSDLILRTLRPRQKNADNDHKYKDTSCADVRIITRDDRLVREIVLDIIC